MGLTLLKVCLGLAMVVAAVHCEGHGHGPAGLRERAREGREGGREGGREHHREASPRDGPRTRREPPSPPRHHYGPGPPGPPSSGPRPSKSSASVYGPPHGHSHHGHAAHHHGPSSKPRYGPPPSSPTKHRKPVYGPKGKGKGHSHSHSHGLDSHSHSHGLDSYEATSTYDRPTRQSYGPSKSGYGHPTRGSSLGSGSSHKPHRPKATYSLSGAASAGGYGAPSKPSYGPPSKPSKPHSGNKYRKNKYRGQKPVYGPSKPFKPSSTFSSPPSATYSGASPSSAEYSPPSDHSVPSHLVNSYGEPASHGPSLASYSPGKVSSSLAHSAESSSGSVGSYEDTSYEPSYSSGGYGKPQQHGDGNTEIQPSISYTLLPTYGGGSTLSPDHKPSSSGGSYQDSYKPKTPYSYRAPYDGTSFKSPVSHGGAATSYISVNHPGATAQPPASSGGSSSSSSEEASAYGYGSASSPAAAAVSPGASHGQAVLTTGYRAPDSSYEGTAHYASKPAAATYYSSIPAYGRQQGAGPSQSFRQQQQQQQQYGDIQTAGSSLHAQQVQPPAPENFQAPAEVFGFVPYKSVAVSASVNAQGASAPIHVPSHPSHAANEVQQTAVQAAAPTQSTTPNFAGGLSPQDWDAYYGDSSKQAKPLQPQQPQQQSDVLSPNYYDPLPQQQEEHQQQHQQQQQPQHHQDAYGSKVSKHRHHSSNSRKKDTTQAHLKMLLQQRAQQQQQANKRYSQQAQVLAQQQQQQQQQQQHADARDSYATEEDAEEGEEGEDVEDARRR